MQLKATIIVALTSALAGAYLTHALTDAPPPTQENLIATSSPSEYAAERTNEALKKIVIDLQQENMKLKAQLATAKNKEPSTSIESTSQDNPEDRHAQAALHQQIQQLELEKQLKKANELTDWLQKSEQTGAGFDLNTKLAEDFAKEERNPDWADAQENQLRNLFIDSPELAEFALKDSQCKSNQCELTVSISSLEQSDQLLQKINKALSTSGKNAAIIVAADPASATTRLYISEDANHFEFN